jgi:hypothetical protein
LVLAAQAARQELLVLAVLPELLVGLHLLEAI